MQPRPHIRAFWRADFRLWALLTAIAWGVVAVVAFVGFVFVVAVAVLVIHLPPALRRFWREWLTPSARELPEFAAHRPAGPEIPAAAWRDES